MYIFQSTKYHFLLLIIHFTVLRNIPLQFHHIASSHHIVVYISLISVTFQTSQPLGRCLPYMALIIQFKECTSRTYYYYQLLITI